MAQVALTDASTLTWDLEADPIAILTATAGIGDTRTLPNSVVATGVNGINYQMTFKQDGVGGRSVLFDTYFKVAGEFDTAADKRTLITIVPQFGEADVILTPIKAFTVLLSTESGITASTSQSQGNGALTAQINEVDTVANPNDTVTLPAAVIGLRVEIINNGDNVLQIFPASGDDLSMGVDNSITLDDNESIVYTAYDTTNWSVVSKSDNFHAQIYDQDNTDPFTVNDAGGDFHSYHTNGMAAVDLEGFTFDIGGAGTSFPIASVADGVDTGNDIEVTTTGSHGLADGDIVSQTNLSDPAYVGVFIVKDIISATKYEVAGSYTATGTGTMDQAATLTANVNVHGHFQITWAASGTPATSNETFDFHIYKDVSIIPGSKSRKKLRNAADYGTFGGVAIVHLEGGEKISYALSNTDTAGNITIRNFTLVIKL